LTSVRLDPETAVVDANVFYSQYQRNVFMTCAPCSLVTWNLRHFNSRELATHGVSVSDPDSFLCRIFAAGPDVAFAATARSYSFLSKRPGAPIWSEYVDILGRDGLKIFAEYLRNQAPTTEIESDTDVWEAPKPNEGS
jgi:hypothetical protein